MTSAASNVDASFDAAPMTSSSAPSASTVPVPVEELRLSATALIVIGICELASIPVSFLTAAWFEWFTLVLASVFTAFSGVVTILTGLSLRRMQNSGITIVGLVLSAIPSLWWMIKLPFVLIALNAMRKQHVRAAFQEVPWKQSDAWQHCQQCMLGAKQVGSWAGHWARRLTLKLAIPLKWLLTNRKLQWSLLFVLGSVLWSIYATGAVTFAIHADEMVHQNRGLVVTSTVTIKSWVVALLPYVVGLLVLGRHCQRRFRGTVEDTKRSRAAGLIDALLTMLLVSLLASVSLSALSHLGGFVYPEPLADEVNASKWLSQSSSRGLDWIYLGYALIAGLTLFLVWSGWMKLLTQCLVVITLIVLPIASMALAGTGTSAPFYWSMLLPIWLAVPIGIWVLFNSVTTTPQKAT